MKTNGERFVATGISRSGTFALHKFFESVGINSYHQRHYRHETHKHFFNYSRGERWVVQYDLDNPITKVVEAVEKMGLPADLPIDGHFFISTWAISEIMYLLSIKYPSIRWIILVRDIKDVANSLRRYVWKIENMPKLDIDYLGLIYINLYQFILKQAKKMNPSPYILHFNDMVRGKKDKQLLSLFNIHLDGSPSEIWKTKYNTLGKYLVSSMNSDILKLNKSIQEELKKVCIPL